MRISAIFTAMALAAGFASALETKAEYNTSFVVNTKYDQHYDFTALTKLLHKAYRNCNATDCDPTEGWCDSLFCITMEGKIPGRSAFGHVYTAPWQVYKRTAKFVNKDVQFCGEEDGKKCRNMWTTDVKAPHHFTMATKESNGKEVYNLDVKLRPNEKPQKIKQGKKVTEFPLGRLEESNCEEMGKVFTNVTIPVVKENVDVFGKIEVNCMV